MHGTDAFQVEGVVIEVQLNGTYQVALPNGHHLLAFVAGAAKKNFALLAVGDKVKLQLSPYDLATGRIVVRDQR